MNQYDVCVFGGGPAGSVVAKRLAHLGHLVVLVEKQAFPRPHIGLSLTPGIHHWLNELGIKGAVAQANFIPATKSLILWESNDPIEKDFAPDKSGYHVDRGHFDRILLQSAVSDGVDVFQPCQLQQLKEDSSGNWQILLTHQGQKKHLTARFIVDAAGRNAVFRGNKKAYLPSTLATYAYWNNHSAESFSFIEAGKNEWYWGAPVSNTQYMTCVFSDPKAVKHFESIEDFYSSKIQHSTLFKQLSLDNQLGKTFACTATAFADHQPATANSIKVGDAAFSTDPLSSQGVQKAIKSAFQGAIVVNNLLQRQNSEMAIDYYKGMVDAEVQTNTLWTKQFYNRQKRFEQGAFWAARKDASINDLEKLPETQLSLKKEDRLQLNPEAHITDVPIVGKEFIETRKGILLPSNREPIVFLQNQEVVPLLAGLAGKTVVQGLQFLQHQVPTLNPLSLMKWLVYERVLCSENKVVAMENAPAT